MRAYVEPTALPASDAMQNSIVNILRSPVICRLFGTVGVNRVNSGVDENRPIKIQIAKKKTNQLRFHCEL